MNGIFKALVALPLLAIPLASCDSVIDRSSTVEEFTITHVKPPKRLQVDVVDSTGKSYRVYVAKRCSKWRQIKVGSKVNLERSTYKYESGRTETHVRIRSASDVCPR